LRRDKVIRLGAIVIVLALLLSLLAGAFSVAPAQAATVADSAKFVQVFQVTSEIIDTDGDGIENNKDPDIDGDGLVNGKDPDIDGDGIENFEDADPVDTTDIDSKSPNKPDRPAGVGDIIEQPSTWLPILFFLVLSAAISAWLLAKWRKK
jgi:hypothetical protein